MALLKEVSGPEPGRQFSLDQPRVVLGRHPDCDIIIEVGAVSRHHAHVLMLDGEYFVEDLNSRNGTFVNDRLIHSRQRLAQDDRLRICDVVFAFQGTTGYVDPSDETSASAILVDAESGEIRAHDCKTRSELRASACKGMMTRKSRDQRSIVSRKSCSFQKRRSRTYHSSG